MSNLTDLAKSNPFSSPFQSSNADNRKIAFAAAAGPAKPGQDKSTNNNAFFSS